MERKNAKSIIKELRDVFSDDDINNIIEKLYVENDFDVNGYRFIKNDNIDDIMKDELLSDEYTLGCFRSWFIADITGLSIDIIEKAQKAKNFELLGALMAKNIDSVVALYISTDGYGHHFAHYDGNEYEVADYYYFRVN